MNLPLMPFNHDYHTSETPPSVRDRLSVAYNAVTWLQAANDSMGELLEGGHLFTTKYSQARAKQNATALITKGAVEPVAPIAEPVLPPRNTILDEREGEIDQNLFIAMQNDLKSSADDGQPLAPVVNLADFAEAKRQSRVIEHSQLAKQVSVPIKESNERITKIA